ncbi:MAG: RNA pseudouridine synthase [Planctomycetota bacterium]|nr:RNA pseudouridine synthase [Planctomycetota bacterium]
MIQKDDSIRGNAPDANPVPPRGFGLVYADNHLLAADKPAGTPSQPDASGDPALSELAKEWLRREYAKPGNVYLALLHRLDRPVSGLVLMARTDKAAGRMAAAFRDRKIVKRYLAIVQCHGAPRPGAELEDLLAPRNGGGMETTRSRKRAGAKTARLKYAVLARSANGKYALLSVLLGTGVKHQIRVQLANIGLPLVGDFRYGAFGRPARPEPVPGGGAILLHAARLAFDHPVGKGRMTLTAPTPGHWRQWLAQMPGIGGEPADLLTGDECGT